jgi:hypothetical protein
MLITVYHSKGYTMLTLKQIAALWGVSPGRVRQFIKENRVPGAQKIGRDWLIPKGTPFPAYLRVWKRA